MNSSQETAGVSVIEMVRVAVPSARNPSVRVIEDVNWRVIAGDYWVVTSLQGAGKSALMMMMAGLIAPQDGSYRLFGEPMPIFEGEHLKTRLRVGLVFEDSRLFNRLTVAENVALPLQYHRYESSSAARAEVAEILDAMELSAHANSNPGGLAWSWQKRVALARALALRPELLLLDTPLGSMDPRHTAWWLNFLDQLSAGGGPMKWRPVTLVVTTDDLLPWKSRARQFALIKHGEFHVLGSREQLENSNDELAKQFLAGASANV